MFKAMPVRFSLAKAASFRPWAKKTTQNSDAGSTPRLLSDRPPSFSPERHLGRVPEDGAVNFDGEQNTEVGQDELDELEEENEIDEELASQGLYRGSYRRILGLYTFVPLTFVISFVLLALVPPLAYPLETKPTYPSVLPFPIPEITIAAGLWSITYLLRTPIFNVCAFLCSNVCRLSHYSFPILLSTAIHSTLSLFFRLLAIPLLLIPQYLMYTGKPTWHDPSFRRVYWVALGWSVVEAIVAIKQGYDGIELYRDVLIEAAVHEDEEERYIDIEDGATKLGRIYGATGHPNAGSAAADSAAELTPTPFVAGSSRDASPRDGPGAASSVPQINPERVPLLQRHSDMPNVDLEASLELQVDEDLEQLMAVRERAELEKYYGIPFIQIPVFVSCLQRANALLFSLGITLLLSSGYLRSSMFSSHPSSSPFDSQPSDVYSITSSSIPPFERFIFNTWPWSPLQLELGSSSPSSSSSHTLMNLTNSDSGSDNNVVTVVFLLVLIVQLVMSLLHTQLVLPKLGVHTVVYIGTLVSLGVFFAGLGVWDALS